MVSSSPTGRGSVELVIPDNRLNRRASVSAGRHQQLSGEYQAPVVVP